VTGTGGGPLRTCLGCRRVRPQAELLRVRRTADGGLEPDPGRRGGGRGAYLCRREACLLECMRRGRWPQAFRAPTAVTPEAVARLRGIVGSARESSVGFEGGR
jgi:predicted RNA-binding protein YlxR (DUF448 family)